MRRREFIAGLGSVALARPTSAHAQQPKRVGVLMNNVASDPTGKSYVAAFREQLRKLGWVEGQNLHIEYRWRGDDAALTRSYAAQLTGLGLDALLAASTENLTALQRLSPTAPIVFVQVSDPVEQGFVVSMARPGGNITGFANYEFSVGGKWVDLLRQMVPSLARVAVMFNPETSPQSRFFLRSIEAAGPSLGIGVSHFTLQNAGDIEPAIKTFTQQANGGLIFPTGSFAVVNRAKIIEVAAHYRLPTLFSTAAIVRDGGLMAYNPDFVEAFRQAGVYVDRILRGTKAGDLPVQTPTKYSLAINLKTAKALGIEVPVSLLLIADEQIE